MLNRLFRLRTTVRRTFANNKTTENNFKQGNNLKEYFTFPKEYSPWRFNHYADGFYFFFVSSSLLCLGVYMNNIKKFNGGSYQLDEEFEKKSLMF